MQAHVVHTDVVILDTERCKNNLQVDQAYIAHVQQQYATAMKIDSQQQAPVQVSSMLNVQTRFPFSSTSSPLPQSYHIEVYKAALHQGADWSAASAPREASVVLLGERGSSVALSLNAASSGAAGLWQRPFTSVEQPDVFQVCPILQVVSCCYNATQVVSLQWTPPACFSPPGRCNLSRSDAPSGAQGVAERSGRNVGHGSTQGRDQVWQYTSS